MRKRIRTRDLVPGMFVAEVPGSWLEHPFWRTSFLLQNLADIERIVAAGIAEVVIDAARGLDVAGPVAPPQPPPVATEPAAPAPAGRGSTPVPVVKSLDEEVDRAARVAEHSARVMKSMFEEARLGKAVDCSQAQSVVEDIATSVGRNRHALIGLTRLRGKHAYTYMHSVAVCALMVGLARTLGLDDGQVRAAGLAGLMHDLGKVAIPDAVLDKPGRLTDAEFDLIRGHPRAGWELLQRSGVHDAEILDVCLHHHERMDGRGYPDGLSADELTVFAKMGAVCDVYDAVSSPRSYKDAWPAALSLRKMAGWRGAHFDETVFDAFVKTIGIYPTGSLVRLKSGKLAVVQDQNDRDLTRPRVKAFYSLSERCRIAPMIVDLARSANDGIESLEAAEKWGLTDIDQLWAGASAVLKI